MQHSTQRVSFMRRILLFSAGALLVSAMMSLCLGFAGAKVAYADPTAAEKQAEAEAVLANIYAMQETLDRLSAEYGEAVAEQEEAEANRDAAETRLGEINKEMADIQDRLGERAREMYRSGGVSFLEILLDTSTFEEFTTSWDLLNKVNENDASLVQTHKTLAAEQEELAAVYNDQAIVASAKAEEAATAEAQAEATVAEMQATYDSLSAEAERLLEEERKAREAEEAARAAAVLAAAQAAAEAEAAAASGSSGDSSGGYSSADLPAYEGGSDTVSRAQACLGAPYVWGGVGPGGYDCSGLVSYCLSGSHTRLGTTYTFMNWPRVSNPQPGDIAVNYSHTGVYIGNGQMIHAATYGVGVITGPVQSGMIFVRYPG